MYTYKQLSEIIFDCSLIFTTLVYYCYCNIIQIKIHLSNIFLIMKMKSRNWENAAGTLNNQHFNINSMKLLSINYKCISKVAFEWKNRLKTFVQRIDLIFNLKYSLDSYRDFLPRGSGIVTRRPLILQLINGPAGKN